MTLITGQSRRHGLRIPLVMLSMGVLLTLGLFVLVLRQTLAVYKSFEKLASDEVALDRLRSELTESDSVLAWSAAMIVGGNAECSTLYERFHLRTITAIRLVENWQGYVSQRAFAEELERYFNARTHKEREAIRLAARGESEAAVALLASPEYSGSRRSFRAATQTILNSLHDRHLTQVENLRGRLITVEVLVAVVLLASWLAILVILRVEFVRRHRTEASLRESEAGFRSLAENAADGIFISDNEHGYAYANEKAALITGYEVSELLDLRITDLVTADERGRVLALLRQRLTGNEGAPSHFETRLVRKDGSQIVVDVAAARTVWKGNHATVIIVRDMTERRRAEEELARLSRQTAEILNSAGDGIYGLDASGRVSFVNPAALRMFGRTADELIGKRIHDVIPHQRPDREKYELDECPFCGALADGIPRHRDNEISWRKDGTPFSVEFSATPIHDGEKAITGVVVVFRDISERKRVMEELKRSEERLTRALEGGNTGLWDLDMITGELYFGPEGPRPQDFDVSESENTLRAWEMLAHPDDVQAAMQQLTQHVEGKSPFVESEFRVRTKGGEWRWILVRGKVVARNYDGTPLRMSGTHEDITVRKQAEQAVRESEERFRTLFEAAYYGIVIHDHGRILAVNDAAERMFQTSATEILGTSIEDFISIQSLDVVRRHVAEGYLQPYEAIMVRKDGSEFEAEIVGRPCTYQGQSARMAAVRDISARKKAERDRQRLESEIREAQKLESLGILAGGIAHDFNNLLAGILGFADLALVELPPQGTAHDYLQRLITTAQRAADLTRQMLAYSGRGKFVVAPVNLSSVVEEMIELLKTVISKKAVLRCDFEEQLPAVEADATQVRQIVMNLITNASEALGPHEGAITVRTGTTLVRDVEADHVYWQDLEPAERLAYLSVSDTGQGMTRETLARIFDPFFTTKFAGRGLGLSAVLGIVRGHRGAIRVDSRLGFGTTITAYFPCTARSIESSLETERPMITELPRSSGTILVVDDDEQVLNVAASYLRQAGFTTLLARDGQEALEVFEASRNQISLVLLDFAMPHLSGDEVLTEMHRVRPETRVILSSGYAEQEVTRQFVNDRFVRFIQKPYRLDELVRQVRDFLTDDHREPLT